MKTIISKLKITGKLLIFSVTFTLIVILTSGCDYLSLADDILPPPGSELPAAHPTRPAESGPLYPLVALNPIAGEVIYQEACTPCHGTNGRGDGPQASRLSRPPNSLALPEVYSQATPAEWYSIVTEGNLDRSMPPFSSLSARQRWDVVAYLYILNTTPETHLEGMDLYQANCAECHGESGRGDGPKSGSLSTVPTNFTDQAFMAKNSANDFYVAITQGVGTDMPSFSDQLSEDDRWTLATTLRSFTFAISGERVETLEIETEPLEDLEAFPQPDDPEVSTPMEESELTSETGRVTGMVINASGGTVPTGSEVSLHGFENMQETFTEKAIVQPDGSFSFEAVEMPEGRAYIASIEYQQTPYGSDVVVVDALTNSFDLKIHVFDATTDASVLAVDRLHIFFEYQEPNTLSVTELYILSNPSTYTVVPTDSGEPVIIFNLPDGASNLRFDDGMVGERFIETAGGFGDTAVVRPGMGAHQVLYAYDMPYERELHLTHPLSMPIEAVVILMRDDGLKLQSEHLYDAGNRDVQGENFKMYTSNRLEAGSQLAIEISGRPRIGSGFLSEGSGSDLVIGLAAFGLALIAAGILLFRRNRVDKFDKDSEIVEVGLAGEATSDEDLPEDADTLMDTIIALDDLYKEGELPEEVYHRRRFELKEQLRKLLED